MRTVSRTMIAGLAFLTTAGVATTAMAQQAQASAQGQAGMGLPGAAPQAAATAGSTDHDMMIGTLGIGFLGRRSMRVGNAAMLDGQGDAPTEQVDAPVVGVRYWLDQMIGIDAGVGFNYTGDSTSQNGQDVNKPSRFAFLLHGGLPLSLAQSRHLSFQIVPEMNIGFAKWSLAGPMGAPDTNGNGFHLDIGARAGGEVQFGFIGIPQLALQAGVGLRFAMDKVSTSVDTPGGPEAKQTITSIGTTVQDNPWNIFTGNVAAIYYF